MIGKIKINYQTRRYLHSLDYLRNIYRKKNRKHVYNYN